MTRRNVLLVRVIHFHVICARKPLLRQAIIVRVGQGVGWKCISSVEMTLETFCCTFYEGFAEGSCIRTCKGRHTHGMFVVASIICPVIGYASVNFSMVMIAAACVTHFLEHLWWSGNYCALTQQLLCVWALLVKAAHITISSRMWWESCYNVWLAPGGTCCRIATDAYFASFLAPLCNLSDRG